MNRSLRSSLSIYIFAIYSLVVLLLLFLPLDQLGSFMEIKVFGSFRLGYVLHALAFIPLVPLWIITWPRHNWFFIVFLALVIAAALETIHLLLSYRNFDLNDMWANLFGAFIGGLLARTFVRSARKNLNPSNK